MSLLGKPFIVPVFRGASYDRRLIAKPHINFARVRLSSMGFAIASRRQLVGCGSEKQNYSPQPRSLGRLVNAV